MKPRRFPTLLLCAGVLLAACQPGSAVLPTAAATDAPTPQATPAQPEAENCLAEEQLNAGQIDPAQLRGLDTFCLTLVSGEKTLIQQAEAIASIRALAQAPNLEVTFQGMGVELNAPQPLPVAVFQGGDGAEYRVETGSNRVVEARLQIGRASGTLSLEELRAEAERIVGDNTPEFAGMQAGLYYEEGAKGDMHFFRWEDRTYPGDKIMPPMAQVGLAADGRLVTYVNSLFVSER